MRPVASGMLLALASLWLLPQAGQSGSLGSAALSDRPTVIEAAHAFARAVRARDVGSVMRFIDRDGVTCVDSAVPRVEVERQLRTDGTWLRSYFFDPAHFRAKFADLLHSVSFAELVESPRDLTIAVPAGQGEEVVCVNFVRKSTLSEAQLCFLWKHERWVLAELPNCV